MNLSPLSFSHLKGPAAVAVVALCAALPLKAETDGSIRRSFDAKPGGKLVVEVAGARVEVQGTGGSQVVVEYTRIVSAGSKEEEERILKDRDVTLTQAGDTVSLVERQPQQSGSNTSLWGLLTGAVHNTHNEFHVSIKVPAQFNVDLRTSGGSIDLAAVTGQATTRTSGGSMRFFDIAGNLHGRTSGGRIELQRFDGDVDLGTSGGSITVADGKGRLALDTSGGSISISKHSGNVTAGTSGGSINLSLVSAPDGENRLSSSGGSITVSLPANSAVDIDASTSGGGVTTDLPVTKSIKQERNRLVGSLNGGGPLLHLRTSGGSVRVLANTLAKSE